MAEIHRRNPLRPRSSRNNCRASDERGNRGLDVLAVPGIGLALLRRRPVFSLFSTNLGEYLSGGLCVTRRSGSRLRRTSEALLGSCKTEPGTLGAKPAFFASDISPQAQQRRGASFYFSLSRGSSVAIQTRFVCRGFVVIGPFFPVSGLGR